MSDSGAAEASVFTILGATGDLARRKLLPALYRNHAAGRLHPQTRVLGVSRKPFSDDAYRGFAEEALGRAGVGASDRASFLARVEYQSLGDVPDEAFTAVAARIGRMRDAHALPPNDSFYLSLPPRVFVPTIAGLGRAGLADEARGWSRLVIEKPFGRDLESARALNDEIHEHFREHQIFRIDHYLGKETVQNLLVFRLANALIESSWNRDRIDAVQIHVAESLGVGTRAGYYDHAGAVRDMLQNHIAQLVSLVAMEVPASFEAAAIRYEKLKVLRSIAPLDPSNAIRGRYAEGRIDGDAVPGYLAEDGVSSDSRTETFIALELAIDSWRWQGVPFYVRTGKRLARKTTQIAIRFREAPVRFFQRLGCRQDSADVLTITLQPNEGFSFHFDIKVPGEPLRLERVPLQFRYGSHFPDEIPDAYQALLLDVLEGDQTLFVHGDEVEESWRIFDPLLREPSDVVDYPSGSWGPDEARHLAIPETSLWQNDG